MQNPAESSKLTRACYNCRERKVKCSGGSPCRNCLKQKGECFYPASRRCKRPKGIQSPRSTQTQTQLTQMEVIPYDGVMSGDGEASSAASQLHRHPAMVLPTPSHSPSGTCDGQSGHVSSNLAFSSESSALSRNGKAQSATTEDPYATFDVSRTFLPPVQSRSSTSYSTQTSAPTRPETEGHTQTLTSRVADAEEGVIPLQNVNWEHHGPWSWVSVCSQPGLRWVCERTRTDEFNKIANGLTKSWSRRLKIKRIQAAKSRVHEPEKATAWKYVAAYFEESYDAIFGILHRPTFEARLHDHFDQPESAQREDPSWFALRNVVYAAGCRCVLAKDPSVSFVDAEAQVWQLFGNALSVFSELIFGHSGLTAVQALAIMTFYTEGLGSPALEYPLCTNAVHLAQAKGLHREPSKSWGLSESDVQNRNWLWWAIYCLEKQIAFRSGRPSVIDDDNISTSIPTAAPPGSTIDVEIFTFMIKHAQISAQISRRIMSVKAFKQSAIEAVQTVHDIHNQLEHLVNSLPPYLKVGTPVRQDDPSKPHRVVAVYLHFAIYGSLMATHIIFFYPWISVRFGTESNPTFQDQVTSSADTIAKAARQIILVLRSLTTDVAIPAALAFYYPMYAHINLFVYTLRYPSLPTALGDLALLDICAGHFGHIELVTSSKISFHFPRESAALASRTVKAAEGKEKDSDTIPSTPQAGTISFENARIASSMDGFGGANGERLDSVPHGMVEVWNIVSIPLRLDNTNTFLEMQGDAFDAMDFDMEAWNIFSSVDINDNLNAIFGDFPA